MNWIHLVVAQKLTHQKKRLPVESVENRIASMMNTVRKMCGKSAVLAVAGILPTMYNGRTLHSQEVLDEIRTSFRVHVFPMVVKHSVRFKEAPAAGLSIIDYAPEQDGAQAYTALAKELLQ